MIILLIGNKLPKHWEPSTVWYLAAIEFLFIDSFIIGLTVQVISNL